MRTLHELSLLLGLYMVSPIFLTNSGLQGRYSLPILALAFLISACTGIVLCFRHRPLPARTVSTYFVAVLGLAFVCVGGVNDYWVPLKGTQGFAWIFWSLITLFVIPWVSIALITGKRTPLAFDVVLAPFMATLLYLIMQPKLNLLWEPEYWRYFVVPSVALTYLYICSPFNKGKSTLLTLCISTAILFVGLLLIIPAHY